MARLLIDEPVSGTAAPGATRELRLFASPVRGVAKKHIISIFVMHCISDKIR